MSKNSFFSRLKSVVASVAAVAMAVGMMGASALPAAAETTNSLTITNTGETAHTFELYQIFKGTLSGNATDGYTLSDVRWGSGVTDAGQSATYTLDNKTYTGAVAVSEALTNANIQSFADALVTGASGTSYLQSPTESTSVAKDNTYKFDNLDAGYYLVMDESSSQTGEKSAYTAYVFKVAGEVTASTKIATPTFTKEVQDINDSTQASATDSWSSDADYDIGDDVPYKLTATLPTDGSTNNWSAYESYKLVFTDDLTKGLDFNKNSVKVYVNSVSDDNLVPEKAYVNGTEGSNYTVSDATDLSSLEQGNTYYGGHEFTVTIPDVKSLHKAGSSNADGDAITVNAGDKIIVTYTAKLNSNAVVGSAGNPNKATLTYSNNPNQDGEGSTGTTPEETAIVFTYKLVVNKTDKDGYPLAGAKFTLTKVQDGQNGSNYTTYTNGTEKEATPVYTQTKDETVQSGKTYYTTTDNTNYTAATDLASFDGSTTYYEISSYTLTFTGLDDGMYKLSETGTPIGYNTMSDVTFTVTGTHSNKQLTALSVTKSADTNADGVVSMSVDESTGVTNGEIDATIKNLPGSNLPSTGGAGRFIYMGFGAAGLAMVIALLAAKKRRNA